MRRLAPFLVGLAFIGVVMATRATAADTLTTPQGTVITSYSASVSAAEVYQTMLEDGYGGNVAGHINNVDIRDGAITMTGCSTSVLPDGTYLPSCNIQFGTASYVAHPQSTVAHEYGHVYGYYYKMVVQAGSWDSYLEARGLLGDPRIGTGYCWYPAELFAEDYRQLLAAPDPNITGADQCNFEIPEAAYVPGLTEFMALTWTDNDPPPTYGQIPTPTLTPTPSRTPGPSATPLPPRPTRCNPKGKCR